MEKTETYHFVIFFFFVFFSTFFSLSGIRTHILLFTLPLALVRSDAVAAAVAVLVPPVAAAHRHLLFFFYYHLPKSILRLCWYLLHTFKKIWTIPLILGNVFFSLCTHRRWPLYTQLFLIFTLLENKLKFQTHKQIFNPEFSNTRRWSRLMLSSLSSVCLPVSYSYFIWHLFKLFFYVLCLLIISFSRTPSRFFSCCGFIYVYLRNTAGGGTRDDEMMCLMIFGFYLYIAGVYGDVHRVKILFNKKDTALIQMAEPHQAQLGNGIKVGCWTLLANDSFCVFLLV